MQNQAKVLFPGEFVLHLSQDTLDGLQNFRALLLRGRDGDINRRETSKWLQCSDVPLSRKVCISVTPSDKNSHYLLTKDQRHPDSGALDLKRLQASLSHNGILGRGRRK